MIVNG